jgi:hypothetical protein
LLESDEHVVEVRTRNRIVERDNGAARVPEDQVRALSLESRARDLRAGHPLALEFFQAAERTAILPPRALSFQRPPILVPVLLALPPDRLQPPQLDKPPIIGS